MKYKLKVRPGAVLCFHKVNTLLYVWNSNLATYALLIALLDCPSGAVVDLQEVEDWSLAKGSDPYLIMNLLDPSAQEGRKLEGRNKEEREREGRLRWGRIIRLYEPAHVVLTAVLKKAWRVKKDRPWSDLRDGVEALRLIEKHSNMRVPERTKHMVKAGDASTFDLTILTLLLLNCDLLVKRGAEWNAVDQVRKMRNEWFHDLHVPGRDCLSPDDFTRRWGEAEKTLKPLAEWAGGTETVDLLTDRLEAIMREDINDEKHKELVRLAELEERQICIMSELDGVKNELKSRQKSVALIKSRLEELEKSQQAGVKRKPDVDEASAGGAASGACPGDIRQRDPAHSGVSIPPRTRSRTRSAQEDGRAWGLLEFGNGDKVRLASPQGLPFRIGREPTGEHFFRVKSVVGAFISRCHCEIVRLDASTVQISAVGSGPLWVNDTRLRKSSTSVKILRDGDQVKLFYMPLTADNASEREQIGVPASGTFPCACFNFRRA